MKSKLKRVKEKQQRGFRKWDMYDGILDAFLEVGDVVVEVEVEGMSPKYLRTQLNKRIKVRSLNERVKILMINDIIYLARGT